ncbi:hypothetical protein FACS189494_08060 [Spirochaetia bacterium]|nr:hypothetical protein FACS189494_08060 [Spirochaetia bacterium]
MNKFTTAEIMTPIFIAGPCVIETEDILHEVAQELVRINKKCNIN